MADRLITEHRVPIAVINGAEGGQPIGRFGRDAADPSDPGTNYGRLLGRLRAAGVADHVTGVFWLQGEADDNDAAVHTAGVTRLVAALRADLAAPTGGDPAFVLMQVRSSPCRSPGTTALRDAQRRLAARLHATLMTLNGLTAGIGCHWDYPGGYAELGDWAAATVDMIAGRRPAAGVRAADVEAVTRIDRVRLAVTLTHADRLRIPAGAGRGFRLDGSRVRVTAVRQQRGRLILRLSGPVPRGAVLDYVGFRAGGPWIRNAIGMGLPTFRVPVR